MAAESVKSRPRASLRRRFRVHALYGLVAGVGYFLKIFRPLGAPVIGAALGWLTWALVPSFRKRPLKLLDTCYGDTLSTPQKKHIVRRMYQHFGRATFEILRMNRSSGAEIESWVEVQGEEHLRAGLERGKGVIIVTGHIGNWELMAAWVARRAKLSVLARSLPNWKLNEWLVALRSRFLVQSIDRGTLGAARESLRLLRRGEVLGILIDQDTDVDGAFVPFFGTPAHTPTGAAALAVRTGAVLLPTFITRVGRKHLIRVEEPVVAEAGGDKQGAQVRFTAWLTSRIEAQIRLAPEQWVWVHSRFKTRPPDR